MMLMNMSSEELAAEYRADLPEINASNDIFDNSKYVSKQLYKNYKKQMVGFTRVIKTKRRNEYLNVFTYIHSDESNRSCGKWNYIVYTMAMLQTSKGRAMVAFFNDAKIGVIIQAHFFNRYKERMLSECDWKLRSQLLAAKSLDDIVALYTRRNCQTAWIPTESKFGCRSHIFAPVPDGAALYQWNEKTSQLQCNTFITKTMYSEQQQEMENKANEYKEWHKKVEESARELYDALNS